MNTTTTNTSYDWDHVSDEYLNEIIAIEISCAKRFVSYHQEAKFERAVSNIEAAQAERDRRANKS